MNSSWLKEMERINSDHRMYQPESWHDLNHYIFWFHDSTFECIARSFQVETHRMSMKDLLSRMEQSWGAENFNSYLRRPDVQRYRKQLDQLSA